MKANQAQVILNRLRVPLDPPNRKGKMQGSCPFAPWRHKNGQDKSPSFVVFLPEKDSDRTTFYCSGCKAKGTFRKLAAQLALYRHEDYSATLEEIASLEGQGGGLNFPDYETLHQVEELPKPLNEAIYDGLFPHPADFPEAVRFLQQRRIRRQTVEDLGILYDEEKRRLLFPVRGPEGELYGFSGRAVYPEAKAKVLDYEGLPKRWLILGRERWVDGKPVLLTEGLIGYARLHDEGVEEIFNIGAILGSSLNQEKADVLTSFGAAVFGLLDPDAAGDDGTFGTWDEELKRRVIEDSLVGKLWGQVPIYIPQFPEGVTDVDDLTFDQIDAMRRETNLFAPDKFQLRILKGPKRK